MSDKVKRARASAVSAALLLYKDPVMGNLLHLEQTIDSLILAVGEEVRERAAVALDDMLGEGTLHIDPDRLRSLPLDDMVKP